MDLITFRCAACKQVLKVAANKAGRKAKCKCGAELTIPLVSEDLAAAGAAPPAPPPPPPPPAAADDDDDASAYGLAEALAPPPPIEVVHTEKPRKKGRTEEEQEDLAEARRQRRAALRRAPLDIVLWERIRVGILLILIATCIWIGAFVLHKLILVIGMFNGPEYATLTPVLIPEPTAVPGEEQDLDKTSFVIGLLVGSDSLDAGLWLARISQLLILLQGLAAIAGYSVCLVAPPRYGARGLAIAALALTGVNLLLQLVFKLLPLTGAMDYVMIPLVAPEIPMIVGNIERMLPLHVFWSGAPFWEIFIALLIQMLLLAEPVLFCMFLRATALQLKDDWMQSNADAMILLALGTAFGLLSYYLLSITGTSEVVGWTLRVVYGLWAAFFLGQLIWYAVLLHRCRERIAGKLAEEEE